MARNKLSSKMIAIKTKKGGILNKIAQMVRKDYGISKDVKLERTEPGCFSLGNVDCSYARYRFRDLVDEVIN